MKIVEKLKQRWQIESSWQVFIILVVFACTGSTAVYVKKYIFDLLGVSPELPWWIRTVIWIVTILPVYNVLLIIYGTLFGQRKFFWWFLKKTFGRLIPGSSSVKIKKTDSEVTS